MNGKTVVTFKIVVSLKYKFLVTFDCFMHASFFQRDVLLERTRGCDQKVT